ncbi:MAG: glycosyl transferase [endosymbiont of Galathealinum brachiosum]|uniref:Glycosyl transferase n=1 Tax=endosymbiont of Galathealinum brachiosum TaxID=2200906 RepID=A0A370D9E9_9GAMM|nr:MAG: glycosyl transferase [endosymbiont of Galathealinum brachiosum]
MHTLSAIIISMNEEDRITPCMESLKNYVDEIIVFDSGSTDKTVDIVKRYTDKVWVTETWPGDGFQKQLALDQASCDWVLMIDADEYLDIEMKSAITDILSQDMITETAFKLPWGNIILGKQLRYGRSARAPVRLFKRIGSHITQVVVHGQVVTEGKISTIKKGFLMHNSLRNFEHLLEKNRSYSWETTLKYFSQKKRSFGIEIAVLRALWTFIHIFILRLGFLDGHRGLLMAVMFAQASFNKYAGLWYLENEEKNKTNPDL